MTLEEQKTALSSEIRELMEKYKALPPDTKLKLW